MKISINKSLRQALIAGMTLSATLTTSVTTASLTMGAMAFLLTAEQSTAAVTIVTGSGGSISGGNNVTDTDITLNFASGYLGGTQRKWGSYTNPATVTVLNWNQSNGSESEALLVNGNLQSAEGVNIFFRVGKEMYNNHIFNGDHSQFQGNFVLAVATGALAASDGKDFVFTNTSATADGSYLKVAGEGEIQMGIRDASSPFGENIVDRDAVFFYTGNVEIANSVIAAETLSLNGMNTQHTAAYDAANASSTISTSYKNSRTANTGTDGATYTIKSLLTLSELEINDSSTAILTKAGSTIGSVTFAGASTLSLAATSDVSLTGVTTVGDSQTLNILGDDVLTLAAGSILNLNGSLGVGGTIMNEGTVTFGENARIDLTGFYTEAAINVTQVIDILNGGGTSNLADLDWTNIRGINGLTATSHTVVFDEATGSLSITLLEQLLSYAGSADSASPSALLWDTSALAFNEGTQAFTADANVNFSGYTDATLAANIAAGGVSVGANSSLDIVDAAGFTFSAGSVNMQAGASFAIDYATLDTTGGALLVLGENSSNMILRSTGQEVTLADTLNLSTFSGTLSLAGGGVTVASVAAFGGATKVALSDSVTLKMSGGSYTSKVFDISGTATMQNTGGTTTLGNLTGSGILNIAGTTNLNGHVDFTGTININSYTTKWGTGQYSTERLAASHINVGASAAFSVEHGSGDYTGTDMTLNAGSTLSSVDLDNGSGIRFGALTVTGNSTISHGYNGIFSFTNLTGDGDISFLPNSQSIEIGQLQLRSITDYHGTITMGASNNTDKIYVADAITQSAGHDLVFASTGSGAFEAENTIYSGEGSVSYNAGVRLIGATVLNSGTLNISSMQQSSTSNTMRLLGGRLNFTGETIDSTNKVTIAAGAVTIGAGVADTTINESFNLGAYGTGTPGTASSPVTTTIDTDNSTGSGVSNITITGTVGQVADSVGALSVIGGGTLTLSGTNTYTGGTQITGSTLIAGSASAFGQGTVTLNSGTLNLNDMAVSNDVTAAGGTLANFSSYAGTVDVTGAVTTSGTITGDIDIAATGSLTLNDTWDYSSAIENEGLLTFASDLQLDLTGATFTESGGVHSLTLFSGAGMGDLNSWLGEGGTVDVSKLTGVDTGYTYTYADGILSYMTGIIIHDGETEPLTGAVNSSITFEGVDATGVAALGDGFSLGDEGSFIGEGAIQVTAGSEVTLGVASTGFSGTTTLVASAPGDVTILNMGHSDALGTSDVVIGADAELVVQAGVSMSNQVTSLATGASVSAGVLTVSGADGATGSITGDSMSVTHAADGSGSITNASLTNTKVNLAASGIGSISNTTLTNTDVTLEAASTLTFNNVVQGVGSSISTVGGDATASFTNHTMQVASGSDTGLNNKGTITDLTTLQGDLHDMLVYELTSISVATTTFSGTLTLDIVMDATDFADFTGTYDASGIVAFEIAGLSQAEFNSEYTNVMINIYNGDINADPYLSQSAVGSVMIGGNMAFFIPEPSTATLSLLALAGLLARRRRKTV